jgi:cyanophycinase
LGEFFERGQGQQGTLVIIPTASPRSDSGDHSRHLALWKDYAWKEIRMVHAGDRGAASGPSIREAFQDATAVWIAGGDQSRLWERFQGTDTLRELTRLWDRGGIVGGTSAGAAIVSRTMISGGVTQPKLANGWGLLPNLIVDQHFSQRGRFERLARAVALHPNQIGVGLDESTGLMMDANGLAVLGTGAVYWYAAETGSSPNGDSSQGKPVAANAPFFGLVSARFPAGSPNPIPRFP